MNAIRFSSFFFLVLLLGVQAQAQAIVSLAWQAGPELPAPRAETAAVLISDQSIYLIGGDNATIARIVSKLAAGQSTWTSAPNLDTARIAPGVVRNGSGILVMGGTGAGEASNEVLNYDYRFGDSQDVAKLLIPRRQFAFATDSSGTSYVIGGRDKNNDELFAVEYYDASLNSWVPTVDLPEARSASSAIGDNNDNIFVFGGNSNGTIIDTVFCYIAIENSWVTLAPTPVAVRNSVAVYHDGFIFVLGGVTADGPVATVQVYNLATGVWSVGTDLPEARYSHAAVVDSLGRIIVMGGYNSSDTATASVFQSQRLNAPEMLPIMTSFPVLNASLDQFYTYTVSAIGNPNPLYSLNLAPTGMTINPQTGTIIWQPEPGQEGIEDVVVAASNRVGSAEQPFSIVVVTDTISPTVPTSLRVDLVTTTSVDLSWAPASDANGVDHYNLFKTKRCGFRNSKTCYVLVKENIPQVHTSVTGLAPLSGFSYVVRAVDSAGNVSGNSNKVSFVTLSAPTGFQYLFNNQAGGLVSVPAKTLLEIHLTSRANPAATYSKVSGPQGVVIDPVSGLIQWTPLVADVGTHQVVVQASNTVGSSSLTIDITVTSDVPQLSVVFNPTTGGSRYAVAGVPFTAQVSDVSNTPPTYALITAPFGMFIDSVSGLITWLPDPGQAGTTNVTVRSTSIAGSTDLTFSFYTHFTGSVSNIQITNLTALHPTASWAPPAGAGANLIQGYTLVAIAKYRHGSRLNRTDRVTYDLPGIGTQIELTGLTTGRNYKLSINAYDANSNRGLVNPVPAVVTPRPGLPNIRWTVNNGVGAGASTVVADQSVVIQLTDANTTSSSTYSIVSAPANFSLDAVTGEALWTPSVSDIGTIPITLRATNAVGPQDFTLNFNVLFSGPVLQADATRTSGTSAASANWQPPIDNVVPVVSYKVTMHWTWSGRKRSRPLTPTSATSIQFSLIPTGAVSHKGVTITPVDALGRLGVSTFVAYGTIAAPSPTNQAPSANAGQDQSIALPHTVVSLNGSATDDGLPNPPGQLTSLWTVVSAPGSVTFGNANSATTTASFTSVGTYQLRLTVSDGSLSHQDDVIITVNPPPVPVNTSPITTAGPDQTITLPTNSINLNGSASDDGLPNLPGQLSYQWSVISAPGTVVFGNANSATTTASFNIDGTYTLQLAASDGVLSNTDNILVIVEPEPSIPNLPPVFDPNGPQAELQGSIQEVGSNYIVVSGSKVWHTATTVIKFEDGSGSSLHIGQSVELKGSKNTDGSITASKIQVGG